MYAGSINNLPALKRPISRFLGINIFVVSFTRYRLYDVASKKIEIAPAEDFISHPDAGPRHVLFHVNAIQDCGILQEMSNIL